RLRNGPSVDVSNVSVFSPTPRSSRGDDRGEGPPLAAKLVAVPNPNPLPTEEWGEEIARGRIGDHRNPDRTGGVGDCWAFGAGGGRGDEHQRTRAVRGEGQRHHQSCFQGRPATAHRSCAP